MPGTLYVVATPIGNLADASPRALEVLRAADLVACEDTRTTRTLLARHGIERAHASRCTSTTSAPRAPSCWRALREGSSVALVSDAGTPGISDPGALLVDAAHREGMRVVPGARAERRRRGLLGGRLRRRPLPVRRLPAGQAGARRKALEAPRPALAGDPYEAPHRVLETVADLRARFGGEREIVIARELTKKFEEIARMPLARGRRLAGGRRAPAAGRVRAGARRRAR